MKKPDDGKPNAKSAVAGVGCLLSPFLLLLLVAFGTTFYNNFRLWRFERNFAALNHPAQSKFVRRERAIGLFGNGNHCDYFIAEVHSFSGSQNAVRKFYKSARVAVPNRADDPSQDVKNGTQSVEVEFLPSPLPLNYKWKYSDADDWNLSAMSGQKNLYVVLIMNSGESYSWDSICDLRCT